MERRIARDDVRWPGLLIRNLPVTVERNAIGVDVDGSRKVDPRTGIHATALGPDVARQRWSPIGEDKPRLGQSFVDVDLPPRGANLLGAENLGEQIIVVE